MREATPEQKELIKEVTERADIAAGSVIDGLRSRLVDAGFSGQALVALNIFLPFAAEQRERAWSDDDYLRSMGIDPGEQSKGDLAQ